MNTNHYFHNACAFLAVTLFIPSAQAIDQDTFDEFCLAIEEDPNGSEAPQDAESVCFGAGEIGQFGVGITTFGNSLSPTSSVFSSALANTSISPSLDTIEDRLATIHGKKGVFSAGKFARSEKYKSIGGGASADGSIAQKWGVFGNITQIDGERDDLVLASDSVTLGATEISGGDTQAGFDYDNTNLTVGLDYQFSPNIVLGGVGSYTDGEAENSSNRDKTGFDEFALSVFGSYYMEQGFYFDAVLGAGFGSNETLRDFTFTTEVNGDDVNFATDAKSDADVSLYTASLGAGYNHSLGAWTLSPSLKINWTAKDVDSYQESSVNITADSDVDDILTVGTAIADDFLLDVDQQDIRSLTSVFGFDVNRAVNMSWGVVQPQLSISWINQHEDPEDLTARFIAAEGVDGADFVTETPELDDSFFTLGIGATATLPNNIISYVYIDTFLGNDDIDQTSISLGVRRGF